MSTSARRSPARLLVAVSALVTVLCALGFALAPVNQPDVRYSWPQAGSPSAVALPLMPYQPVAFSATISCAAVRATAPGLPVLATTPPDTPDGVVGGLRVVPDGNGVRISSDGVDLAAVPLPDGGCTLAVRSTPERTVVTLDGRPVADRTDDVRPVVAALVTGAPTPAGLAVELQTDTRFQTTPSLLKWLLGAGCLLGIAGVVVGVRLAEGRWVRRPRRFRPTIADGVVGLGLVVWAAIGPATVDDGYIAGIVRSRGENGFIGNVYRWLNAPEAPFSWFYEVDRAWDALAPGPASVLWMRVPATVLGATLWLLVTRGALPRVTAVRPSVRWVAALVFAAWWLPFGLSMRPEPWVAVGSLAAWIAAERAVATGRTLPLVGAGLVGGLTVALTPGALVGVVPLLVALPALVRGSRTPTNALGAPLRVAVTVAGLAVAVLPMIADQSLAAVLEGTRVRQLIGGGEPWYAEINRYRLLLTPDDVQGGLAARLPVLLLLVALPAVAYAARVLRVRGVRPGPATRLVATLAVGLVLLTLSPTKWTLHFGTFAGLGTAAVTLLVTCWSARALRTAQRPVGWAGPVVLGAVLLAFALVLVGHNQWAYASDWGVFWDTIPPQIARVALADVVLYVTVAVVLVAAVLLALRPRLAVPAAGVVLVATTLVVALVGLSFVKVTRDRAGTFSYGSASLAALRGDPCGLGSDLTVEPDPRSGLLSTAPGPVDPVPSSQVAFPTTTQARPAVGLTVAGEDLPGWSAPTDRPAVLRSPWFSLPAAARDRTAPVVVAVSGSTGARAQVSLQFAAGALGTPEDVGPTGDTDGTAVRDLRALAPEGTTLVRVVATSDDRGAARAAASSPGGTDADTPLAVSVPRVPRTEPLAVLLPPGSPALVDWPVAFVFPCLRLPALTSGTAEMPRWRLVPPGGSDAGEITVSPTTGGPFLTPRLLVDEQRIPVYLTGDPQRDPVGLVRWVPRQPYGAVEPVITARTVAGWTSPGRVTVPTLDQP